MSEDLRDKITAAIDRAEAAAVRATAHGDIGWYRRDGILVDNAGMIVVRTAWQGFADNPWPDAQHIALNDPAAVLRRCAADRRLLSIAMVMAEQAELKQQSADRFGDPKDNDDMDGVDRIAWLLQSDMAQTYAGHGRQIEQALAEAWGVDA